MCKNCQKSFTSKEYNKRQKTSEYLKNKAVKDFVHTKNSLQEVGARYHVSKTSILNWLNKKAKILSDNFDRIPDFDDILLIAGKVIKLKGKKKVLAYMQNFFFKANCLL